MLFHNPTDLQQKFQIGETLYDVPAGAGVNIPDHMAYVVDGRGMALARGRNPQWPKEGAPPMARTSEALPAEVERLLSSPYVKPNVRDGFVADWSRAPRQRRTKLLEQLGRLAEGRSPRDEAGDYDDYSSPGAQSDDAPGAAEQAGDEAAVGDQLTEAAAAAGRPARTGRRPAGG